MILRPTRAAWAASIFLLPVSHILALDPRRLKRKAIIKASTAVATRTSRRVKAEEFNHNRAFGKREMEQLKVGPKGETSGSERVKAHRGH